MKIERYAAIDIGSNAVRLLIANVINHNGKKKCRKSSLIRVPIRLGTEAFGTGIISDYNLNRLTDVVEAFSLLMKANEVTRYKAYGTAALRESKNASTVTKHIKSKTGIEIEIIEGKKEAMIIAGYNYSFVSNKKRPMLFVDVGGGSTELTLIKNKHVVGTASFKIGTVRMMNEKNQQEKWNEFKKWIKHQTKEQEIHLIASGGNINKLIKMADVKINEPLDGKKLSLIYQQLKAKTNDERIIDMGLNPDRADVIIAACTIFLKVLKWSKSRKIYVPKFGLVDGMVNGLLNV